MVDLAFGGGLAVAALVVALAFGGGLAVAALVVDLSLCTWWWKVFFFILHEAILLRICIQGLLYNSSMIVYQSY